MTLLLGLCHWLQSVQACRECQETVQQRRGPTKGRGAKGEGNGGGEGGDWTGKCARGCRGCRRAAWGAVNCCIHAPVPVARLTHC